MVKEQNRLSTIVSLGLHLAIVILLLFFSKPISILVPSRSDGMEVSLVTMPNRVVAEYSPKVKATSPTPIATQDKPADINVKENNKPPKPVSDNLPKVVTNKAVTPIKKPADETQKVPPTQVQPEKNQAKTSQETKPNLAPKNDKATQKKINKTQVNDLLGDVTSNNTTAVRKGKALGGNPNGTSNSNNLIGNYADQVINAVRPFVVIPDGIDPSAKAVVKVVLNPNLSVRQVVLLKSSGNPLYDQNVQDAINRVKVFPPLPDGANYVDYRILKLTFRPQ